MNIMKIDPCSIANGPGVRVAVFVCGCRNHCPGCFQPETWDFKAGKPMTQQTLKQIGALLKRPYCQGLTILGGEPMEVENQWGICEMLRYVRLECPDKDIWLYTGYTDENLPVTPFTGGILRMIDYLVDGPFIESEKAAGLVYRGSKNQRVLSRQKLKVMHYGK